MQKRNREGPRVRLTCRNQRIPRGKLNSNHLDDIAKMTLEGIPQRIIAEKYGCRQEEVSQFVTAHVYPLWRQQAAKRFDEHYAVVAYLQSVAWAKFHESQAPQTIEQIKRSLGEAGVAEGITETMLKKISRTGEACWLNVVQWCLDHSAKLFGFYAAENVNVHASGELRVAGQTFDGVDNEFLARLTERIAERKAYARSLQSSN